MAHAKRPRTDEHRVVVTGIGTVNSLGLSIGESWSQALNGVSGIAPVTAFNTEKFHVKFAGEVKNFNSEPVVSKKDQKRIDRFSQFALVCSHQALTQSGLQITEESSARGGCLIGVGIGGLATIEEQHQKMLEKGPDRISPFFIPQVISNMASGLVSIQFRLKGPNYSVTSACASGAHAIGEAAHYIRRGDCDFMLAGGAESTICGLAIGGFDAMRALSNRNDAPTKASRPFDKDRDGFVLAEGSAILVLESLEHAQKRGAVILAELLGYGASSDAFHMTTPAPEGAGAAQCMQMALNDSRLNIDQIDYVNAHGTSTPVGDEIETQGLKKVFKEHAKKLWVSSTKSMTGHSLGAAGAIESAFCIQTLLTNSVAPTINLENPSESCDLDYVPNVARQKEVKYVLNNSFGFGGTNASLIFGKL